MEDQTYIVGRERRQRSEPPGRERRRQDSRSRRFLMIPHSSVSRRHGEIIVLNGRIYIRDLGSKNGTYLMREGQRVPLREGYVAPEDQVVFGHCRVRIGDMIRAAETRRRGGPRKGGNGAAE
jgi:pSer/pThr/pTyr-binding forkhead associated (FHA) protein